MIRRDFLKTLSLTAGARTLRPTYLQATLFAADVQSEADGVAEAPLAQAGAADGT